jgi:hypothetical protein
LDSIDALSKLRVEVRCLPPGSEPEPKAGPVRPGRVDVYTWIDVSGGHVLLLGDRIGTPPDWRRMASRTMGNNTHLFWALALPREPSNSVTPSGAQRRGRDRSSDRDRRTPKPARDHYPAGAAQAQASTRKSGARSRPRRASARSAVPFAPGLGDDLAPAPGRTRPPVPATPASRARARRIGGAVGARWAPRWFSCGRRWTARDSARGAALGLGGPDSTVSGMGELTHCPSPGAGRSS